MTVSIGGKTIQYVMKDWLEIDRHNLEEEMGHQAYNYVFIAHEHEKAKSARLRTEAELADLDAEIADEFRKANKDAKKLTEAAVKHAVRVSSKRGALVKKVLDAEEGERFLGAFVYAFVHRKDMLESLARSRGMELSTAKVLELDAAKKQILSRR